MRYLIFLFSLISSAYGASLHLNKMTTKHMNQQVAVTIHYPLLTTKTNAAQHFNALSKQVIEAELNDFNKNAATFPVTSKPSQIDGKNTLEISYQSFLMEVNNQRLISVRYNIYTHFVGTAYPTVQHHVINYDYNQGKMLSLETMFPKNSHYEEAIKSYINKQYARNRKMRNSNYQEYINLKNWNVTAKGLTFTFDDFPHVYGPQAVTIPFRAMKKFADSNSLIAYCASHTCRATRYFSAAK